MLFSFSDLVFVVASNIKLIRHLRFIAVTLNGLKFDMNVTLVFFRYPFSIFGCNFPMLFHHHSASFTYVMRIHRKAPPACGWLVQVSWCLVWCGGRTPLMVIRITYRVIAIKDQQISSIPYSGFGTPSCHTGRMDLDLAFTCWFFCFRWVRMLILLNLCDNGLSGPSSDSMWQGGWQVETRAGTAGS